MNRSGRSPPVYRGARDQRADQTSRLRSWTVVPFLVLIIPAATADSSGIGDTLAGIDGALGYLLVFLLAAIPWFEILLVIPPAIALGLNPLAVGILAFLGNTLPIYGIVVFHRRISSWWTGGEDGEGESNRSRRARRLWERYGLPGLAIAAPVVTGVHLAAVLALLFGASGRAVTAWMTTGIALWTIVLVAASLMGVSIIETL